MSTKWKHASKMKAPQHWPVLELMYLVTFHHWEDEVNKFVALGFTSTAYISAKLKALYNAGSLHKHTA